MDAALVILDGWGLAPPAQEGRDAVGAASTPNFDALRAAGCSVAESPADLGTTMAAALGL